MARFFIDSDFKTGLFELPDQVAHHVRVFRMRINDRLILFNNAEEEAAATIETLGKKTIVNVHEINTISRESPVRIRLIQALASMEKMDTIVQKSVELGVFEIQPVITTRSSRLDAKRAEKKQQHWQKVAISACEQSGRTKIPVILPVCTLEDALQSSQTVSHKYLLNPESAPLLSKRSIEKAINGLICLMIGAEGGFDDPEIRQMESAGFLSVSLGPRVLRTETAGPAAITICQVSVGDL